MNRRMFMKASMAFATLSGMSGLSTFFSQAAWAEDGIADGSAKRFDFDVLKKMAADMAKQAYGGAPAPLPETLATLTPQAYNEIQYDANHSLWNGIDNRQLDVQFFHVGMGFKRRIRMFSVDGASREAREIHFRPELFNYNDAHVDTKQLEGKTDLGFAGFRAFKKPELAKRDIVSFLGASYFRAVDETFQYGLSARGVAIDTFSNGKEEFPDFTAFWFETPKADDTTFVVYTLLDGPSCTGAFKFTIHCEDKRVVMEVENHIYARKDIQQLGISPMTTMFSCGNNERRMCDTIHPQIHDSDRLAMWTGSGEWICRPLNNPQRLTFNAYQDENPRGFGMLQLNHDFDSYQDVIGWYNKRPSLWVEPVGKWGKGAINLMEIPTTGETLDNIVCFWQPADAIKAGSEHSFSYKLYWSGLPPVRSGLARVNATRTGMGGFPEGWAPGEHYPNVWARRFAVDFVGGDLKAAAPKGIEPVINISSGTLKQVEILYVEPINGYRILFDWYPDSDATDPVNMRLFLRTKDETLSETWLYQYVPPPPDKRKYVDDRVMTAG
ncbi:glucan biosynthesis protein D [Erwinia persicina]|uniref:glucan biosynthesis protein D n=1 Tax=Erwinia persicina TaxID=55211 RepID=UPI00210AE335|nr:glucan biosynthesis protein D [Erwinia persicina]MCQ4093403.1 glucan biosynthesis protein D [Erwinia persicina]MCQ4099171.1 glucan biosynthesis protein D [Erwinia persicina]